MKEIKAFFTKDNRLNKGYYKISNIRELDSSFYRKKFEHMLPPIDLMSEFENINPGTLAMLIEMAEQEQCHKHAIDLVNLENYNRAKKMGRIFSLIFYMFNNNMPNSYERSMASYCFFMRSLFCCRNNIISISY